MVLSHLRVILAVVPRRVVLLRRQAQSDEIPQNCRQNNGCGKGQEEIEECDRNASYISAFRLLSPSNHVEGHNEQGKKDRFQQDCRDILMPMALITKKGTELTSRMPLEYPMKDVAKSKLLTTKLEMMSDKPTNPSTPFKRSKTAVEDMGDIGNHRRAMCRLVLDGVYSVIGLSP